MLNENLDQTENGIPNANSKPDLMSDDFKSSGCCFLYSCNRLTLGLIYEVVPGLLRHPLRHLKKLTLLTNLRERPWTGLNLAALQMCNARAHDICRFTAP